MKPSIKTPHSALGLAALLAFCMLSVAAHAQVIRVQTGEHASFTRLVLLSNQSLRWSAGRVPDGYGIRFTDGAQSVDLDDAFRLIPRDRVQNLTWRPDADMLIIESSCDCHLNAFEERAGVLVFDVTSGPAPEGHRFDVALARANDSPAPKEAERRTADLPVIGSSLELRVPFPSPEAPVPDASQLLAKALDTSIRSASNAGLLSHNSDQEESAAIADLSEVSDLIETALDQHIQMRTGREPPTGPEAAGLEAVCPDPGLAAVSTWGEDDKDPLAGIWTGHRPLVITEEGEIDPVRLTAHAQRLIHAGLGTEALAHLSLLPQRNIEVDLLRELAHLVDATPNRKAPQLRKFAACTEEAGLWALLASDGSDTVKAGDFGHILGLFNRLPIHLQRLVGARLVHRLKALGHEADAVAVLAALERRRAAPMLELHALRAELDLEADDVESAEARLGALIYDNSELSPDALLTLLRAREERGETAPEDLLLLAEGYVHELSKTPLAEALKAAVIRGHARAGRFDPALAALQQYPRADAKAYQALRSDLAERLAELAADNTFLIQVFALDLIVQNADLRNSARLALSKRLVSLGFHAEAATLLGDLESLDESAGLLRAHIALAQDHPDLALNHLQDFSSTEAAQLRARAQRALGKHAASATSYAGLEQPAQARTTAWESDEDALIRAHGSPQEQIFVSTLTDIGTGVSLRDQADRASTEVTYDHMRDLLSGSLSFRQAARDLLEQQP